MTEAQDTRERAAEPVACPECGEADLVQKISAIPDWPAEYGPPDRPDSFDLLGVVSLVGGLLLTLVLIGVGAFDLGDECTLSVTLFPILVGIGRLAYKGRQRSQWEEGLRLWKRLYFCPRDEVAFIPGGPSVIPVQEIQRFLYAEREELPVLAPKPKRFVDFSPMPEEFADFERMLEEAKEKSGTLICFECGHYNPIGQSKCEECGAWVRQTARGRWGHGKDK